MEVLERVTELRERIDSRAAGTARRAGRRIAFVPTMGALHEGHLELMRRAKAGWRFAEGKEIFLVVSIFVNPTQFGPGEDYRAYPRDLAADCRKAEQAGADLIFAPTVEEIYPPGDSTIVEVGRLSEGMCGPFRPGHFRGVATVVCKLFNIVRPDAAYFGTKDYQQLKVIERMVEDLRLPVKVVPVETVREPDGLAMSSRNAYLSAEERQAAVALSQGLFAARELAAQGERDATVLLDTARRVIAQEPMLNLEYLELRDAENLETLAALDRPAVLALAARLGRARLIDNVILQVP